MAQTDMSEYQTRIRREMETTAELLRRFASEKSELIAGVVEVMTRCIDAEGTVFFAGNGGSASQAQHAAAELVGRFAKDRKAYRAVALTTDTSILTSVANDYGYEHVFERQIEALGRPGDVFVGISTSGTSANVIKAMEIARSKGITTVGLTGPGGGKMAQWADYLIDVPEGPTWRIQEIHLAVLHRLCAEVEQSSAEEVCE